MNLLETRTVLLTSCWIQTRFYFRILHLHWTNLALLIIPLCNSHCLRNLSQNSFPLTISLSTRANFWWGTRQIFTMFMWPELVEGSVSHQKIRFHQIFSNLPNQIHSGMWELSPPWCSLGRWMQRWGPCLCWSVAWESASHCAAWKDLRTQQRTQ